MLLEFRKLDDDLILAGKLADSGHNLEGISQIRTKPSMIARDKVEEITEFAPGGNEFTSVKLTPAELELASGATGWCDVCKGWEE